MLWFSNLSRRWHLRVGVNNVIILFDKESPIKKKKCPTKLWPRRIFCLALLKDYFDLYHLLPLGECITLSYMLFTWCTLWQIVRYSSQKANNVIILVTSHQPLNTFINFSVNASLWRVRCTSNHLGHQ